MGLFDRFKKQNAASGVLRMWDAEPYKATAHMSGDFVHDCFYVYNFAPINDLRLGTVVELDAIPGDVILRGEGGQIKITEDDSKIAYAIGGVPVGFTGACHRWVKELLKIGYSVKIDAEVQYNQEHGFKMLVLGFDEDFNYWNQFAAAYPDHVFDFAETEVITLNLDKGDLVDRTSECLVPIRVEATCRDGILEVAADGETVVSTDKQDSHLFKTFMPYVGSNAFGVLHIRRYESNLSRKLRILFELQ